MVTATAVDKLRDLCAFKRDNLLSAVARCAFLRPANLWHTYE